MSRMASARRSMTRCSLARALALAVALGVGAVPIGAGGESAPAEKSAVAGAHDPRAVEVVERMAQRIATAGSLSVRGEIAWDVVQPDGKTLEFGATREITVRRPDRLRVELRLREGSERQFLYDGARIVLHDPGNRVYAAVARQGPVDDAVAYAAERLGVPVALSELLSPDLPALLRDEMQSADYVGEETIDGVRCDHVSLRNDVGGLQLWIAQDDSLPRRITISYEHEEGRPQFRARFEGWDLSVQPPDSTFAFEPPEGTERIAFARRAGGRTEGDER